LGKNCGELPGKTPMRRRKREGGERSINENGKKKPDSISFSLGEPTKRGEP